MYEDAIRWAMAQQTQTAGAKALLMVLAANADAEGRVRIPQRELATMASVSTKTISTSLGWMVRNGLIEYDRGNGGELPVTYLRVGVAGSSTVR